MPAFNCIDSIALTIGITVVLISDFVKRKSVWACLISSDVSRFVSARIVLFASIGLTANELASEERMLC